MLFPFIYHPDKSLAVLEESKRFLEESCLEVEISELAWTYHDVGDLIPQTSENFSSGHFFPWAESYDELQISCNLCLFGFYKQAMVSLRSGLEVGLLSVYWNLNDDGHQVMRQWLRSNEDTPRMAEIWKKLIQHRNFQQFSKCHDLQSRLLSLRYLHNYAHTRGHIFSNRVGLSNFQTFEETAFRKWLSGFREVIEVLSICHLVKYPIGTVRYDYDAKFGIDTPSFGGLDSYRVDRLEKLIGASIFGFIVEIGQADSQVQEILEWVNNLPDMSDEQREQQIIDTEDG